MFCRDFGPTIAPTSAFVLWRVCVMKYALDRKFHNTQNIQSKEFVLENDEQNYLHYLKDPIVVLRHI